MWVMHISCVIPGYIFFTCSYIMRKYNLIFCRIIEIAGGREIYSQSRSKAVRKIRANDEYDKRKPQKSPIRQGVWELRGRSNELKKLKNWRDFTETVFSSEICSVRHQEPEHTTSVQDNEKGVSSGGNMAHGEIVIFDDIGDEWHEEERINENQMDDMMTTAVDIFTSNHNEVDPVAKVIGNLPIAVYEGSPRRYGPRQSEPNSHPQLPSAQSLLSSPSVYPPRPGFPQRVVCIPNETEPESILDITHFPVSFILLI